MGWQSPPAAGDVLDESVGGISGKVVSHRTTRPDLSSTTLRPLSLVDERVFLFSAHTNSNVSIQTSKLPSDGKNLPKAAFGKGNLYTVNVCGLCKMTICQVQRFFTVSLPAPSFVQVFDKRLCSGRCPRPAVLHHARKRKRDGNRGLLL